MNLVIDLLCFVGGFVLCWFSKDVVLHVMVGTEEFARQLEVRAQAIRRML